MKNNSLFFNNLFPSLFIILGVIIYFDKEVKDSFRIYSFDRYNLHIIVSGLLISFGLLWIYSLYLNQRDRQMKTIEHSKCPTCKESFNYSELKNGKCKYCDETDTIEIDEYYKKYPEELKDI